MATPLDDNKIYPTFIEDESDPINDVPDISDTVDDTELLEDSVPIEQKLASGFFGNIQDQEPPALKNAKVVAVKLEAKLRLKATLVHPDADKRAGRNADWFNKLSAEEREAYKTKFPGTKFGDKTRLVAPEIEANPYSLSGPDTSQC